MPPNSDHFATKSRWLTPVAFLSSASALVLFCVLFLDFGDASQSGVRFWAVYRSMSPSDAGMAMSGVGEVIAAILGIVITVASIIVQLSATRYTPRITAMFFRDRTNLLVMAFFVVSAVFALWVTFSIRSGATGTTFVPYHGVLGTMFFLTVSLLLMAPYFAYVFDFVEPHNVVQRIETQAIFQLKRAGRGDDQQAVDQRRAATLSAIEQLSDVAMNAIENKDKAIASTTLEAITRLGVRYIEQKSKLPTGWFIISGKLALDPDFVSMGAEARERIHARRTWFEYKALRQFLLAYRSAALEMPELINRIGIDTRYIGEAAIRMGDEAAFDVAIKFMNTYMRRAINTRDVAAAYNVLNQYRHLAETALHANWDEPVVRIAEHFRYYGQVAHHDKIPFITETVAFDLASLNQLAHELHRKAAETLLLTFLELDKEGDSEFQEKALRGVRKAQVKLAAYFLECREEALARRIYDDMASEKPDRLLSIKGEMLKALSDEFWEVNDRGTVFEHMPPERRTYVREFFDWFPELSQRKPTVS